MKQSLLSDSGATVILLAGGLASLALMLHVGRRNPSVLLMILFTGWVLAPFVALALANLGRGSALLKILTVAIPLVSVTVYSIVAFGPPAPQPAFWFLIVPLVSLLLIAVASWLGRRHA